MKTTVELQCSSRGYDQKTMEVVICDAAWGNSNLFINYQSGERYDAEKQEFVSVEKIAVDFELDADGARALSFAFGELAKVLGKRK